jgi:hypothetical protein
VLGVAVNTNKSRFSVIADHLPDIFEKPLSLSHLMRALAI